MVNYLSGMMLQNQSKDQIEIVIIGLLQEGGQVTESSTTKKDNIVLEEFEEFKFSVEQSGEDVHQDESI